MDGSAATTSNGAGNVVGVAAFPTAGCSAAPVNGTTCGDMFYVTGLPAAFAPLTAGWFVDEGHRGQVTAGAVDGSISFTAGKEYTCNPTGGSDPLYFKTRAELKGNEWVINGEKWFSTGARNAEVLVVYAMTDPDHKDPYKRMSMFLVPKNTPGVKILRNVGVGTMQGGNEGYVQYKDVHVPFDAMLGPRGAAFELGQVRLGGGRVHHAMRTVGQCQKALDLMCQRAVSRSTRDGKLGDYQMVQEQIADSYIQLTQFRLMVLHVAWLIDKHKDYKMVRKDIAAVKVAMPKVYHDIVQRAVNLHGALGTSRDTPLAKMWMGVPMLAVADGPTEVHKVQVANAMLKTAKPAEGLFPSEHIPTKYAAVLERFGHLVRD